MVQVVWSDWTSRACAETTLMLSIGDIYIHIHIHIYMSLYLAYAE
jgi:hypothetical protein